MNRQRNSIMEDEYGWARRQTNYQMYSDIGKSLAAHEETGPGKSPGNIVRYYRKRNHPMYTMMTEEEVELYDYYLGRDRWSGGDEAQKYLELLNETLRKRQGEAEARKLKEMDDGLGKALAYGAQGFEAGFDNTLQNTVGYFVDKQMPRSEKQFAKDAIAEDLDGLGKLAYDSIYKVGEGVPEKLVNAATGGMGGTLVNFFAEGGEAQQDALRDGKKPKEAKIIGNVTGGAKVVIPKVGKKLLRR